MFQSFKLLIKQSSVINNISNYNIRTIRTSNANMTKALVLGVYQSGGEGGAKTNLFTDNATRFDAETGGKLKELVEKFGPSKKGKAKTYYGLHPEYPVVSVVGLGSSSAGYNELEDIDEKRENVRSAIATAAKSVRNEDGVDEIQVDTAGDGEAAAEGVHLALFAVDEFKSDKYKVKVVKVNAYGSAEKDSFDKGTKLANAQNVCRRFCETPANLLTPTVFSEKVKELFKDLPSVKVVVRDQQWAESKKMGAFLSVAKGSIEPPKFLELHYNNKPDSKPFAMVGKGICFDSGGISIKPALNMDKMRYDMGGAANVVSTIFALATLQAEVNVVGLTPLCENMPSGGANKPGDIVYAMDGKSISVDNTDAEGRLILADGLCYAHEFKPQAILDIATLTGAMGIALGSSVTGVFSRSSKLYDTLRKAGVHTGDRVWRMPLFADYTRQVTDGHLADLLNIGKVLGKGGSCTAAAFLNEFVHINNWVHLDIAGTMECKDDVPYYANSYLTGRPVRTLFYFLTDYFKQTSE